MPFNQVADRPSEENLNYEQGRWEEIDNSQLHAIVLTELVSDRGEALPGGDGNSHEKTRIEELHPTHARDTWFLT